MKGEYFVPLQTSVVITKKYYVVFNCEELIGTTTSDAIYQVSLERMSL
jgi:hypothetical protein